MLMGCISAQLSSEELEPQGCFHDNLTFSEFTDRVVMADLAPDNCTRYCAQKGRKYAAVKVG